MACNKSWRDRKMPVTARGIWYRRDLIWTGGYTRFKGYFAQRNKILKYMQSEEGNAIFGRLFDIYGIPEKMDEHEESSLKKRAGDGLKEM